MKRFLFSGVLLRGIRNASFLAAGHTLSNVISFLGVIYIARVLGPHDYGVYGTVLAFVGTFHLFTLTGLSKVLVREGCKDLAVMHRLLERTIGLRHLMTGIVIVACIVASRFAPYDGRTRFFILLYSSVLICRNLKGFLQSVFQAAEKLQYMALFSVAERFLYVTLAAALLYGGQGLTAVVLVAIFAQFAAMGLSYLASRRFVRFRMFPGLTWDWSLLRPALMFTLLNLLSYLTIKVDLLMISLLASPTDVGHYAVASRLAEQGIMLRNVLATAFFPIAVKAFQARAVKASRPALCALASSVVLLCGAAVVAPWCRPLTGWLFGEAYATSGSIIAALLFYIGLAWARLPYTTALQATGNEKTVVWTTAVTAGLNIPLNLVLFARFGLIGIAYSTVLVTLVGTLVFCVAGHRILVKQGRLVT